MKMISLALLASAALGAAAYAQNAQQPQQPAQAQRQSGAAQASKPVQFHTQRGEEYRVSRIIGTTVRNNQNENVGEVEDLIMEKSGDVKAAIISVGGFLGIGERWVAVNFESLTLQPDGSNWRVMLNATRDQMKSAPEFKYENTWAQNRGPSTTATTPSRAPAGAIAPSERPVTEPRPSAPPPPSPAPAERAPPASR
ncbi:MAG: PRC-barrel domain-containing protein [Beijerinckiaceae bacterium]